MSQRNLRRLAGKKNASDLANTLHSLKEVASGLRSVVPDAERGLAEASEAVRAFRTGYADLNYQLERQRAVFLRMLHNMMVEADYESLLALETEYGAEYDAMRFLCWVVTLEES